MGTSAPRRAKEQPGGTKKSDRGSGPASGGRLMENRYRAQNSRRTRTATTARASLTGERRKAKKRKTLIRQGKFWNGASSAPSLGDKKTRPIFRLSLLVPLPLTRMVKLRERVRRKTGLPRIAGCAVEEDQIELCSQRRGDVLNQVQPNLPKRHGGKGTMNVLS